jgi:hypothetical protein
MNTQGWAMIASIATVLGAGLATIWRQRAKRRKP